MRDYAKLAKNILEAHKLAKDAIRGMSDGGTCNFDSVQLPCLPRERGSKLLGAVHAAGCSGFCYTGRSRSVLITPPGGQGATRTKAAEVMAKHLQECGHRAWTWYQMD